MPDRNDPTYNALLAGLLSPPAAPSALGSLGSLLYPEPAGLAWLGALAPASPPASLGALSGFGSGCTPHPSSGLGLSGLYGGGSGNSLLGSWMAEAARKQPQRPKRRVFFSFHYQDDINRVNVVRNSWRFRAEDEVQPVKWFDHSIWEDAKKTGQGALKRLIHDGMHYSSVTCVLAGAQTWSRPWVRYEIVYGLARGNGLLTVHIDGVNCMKTGAGTRGHNPLDYLGLKWDAKEDKAHIWENFGGQWRKYPLYTQAVAWPAWLPKVSERRFIMPLAKGSMSYDYAKQNGYQNLSGWAQLAADQAGR